MASINAEHASAAPRGHAYGNFVDPVGLVWRMLRDGGRLGRGLLATELLSVLAKPIDWALTGRERRLKSVTSSPSLPLLFIVGPPRSGTTLVYQALAHALDVSYFSNRNAMFPRSPLAAAQLFEKRLAPPPGEFASLYGKTARLNGVNDAFHIWNEYFGDDNYQAAKPSAELTDSMRQFFDAWLAITNKPLLNKNNRNVDCMACLAEALPTSRFIVIQRSPWFVAQSLIKARSWIQGDEKVGWGLVSETVSNDASPLAHVDAVCRQVQRCHERLDQEVAEINPDRRLHFSYEQFCSQPEEVVDAIVDWSPEVSRRPVASRIEPLQVSNSWSLPDEVVQRIHKQLSSGEAAPL